MATLLRHNLTNTAASRAAKARKASVVLDVVALKPAVEVLHLVLHVWRNAHIYLKFKGVVVLIVDKVSIFRIFEYCLGEYIYRHVAAELSS